MFQDLLLTTTIVISSSSNSSKKNKNKKIKLHALSHIYKFLMQTRKKEKTKVINLSNLQICYFLNNDPGLENNVKDLSSELLGWGAF